jgi:hypothetical protein
MIHDAPMLSSASFLAAACLLLDSASANLAAEGIKLESTERQVGFLELYTSEGCSSCPPAESWLSGLKKSPKLWRELVPVAFHVDYWDSPGWKDPFGSKEFSKRQREYAEHWQSQSLYTPGFVFNGKEWRGWFQRERSLPTVSRAAGILRASSEDGKSWNLVFDPSGSTPHRPYEFYAALLGFELTSSVKGGENRGRKLDHDFVVLKLAREKSRKEEDTVHAHLRLVSDQAITGPHGIAFWVTLANDPLPLQATGGWLRSVESNSAKGH